MNEITKQESPPSPFIERTKLQYAWDSTSLGWLKTCPRLYQYHMLEGYRPRGDMVHLKFGIHYHTALERYDHLRAANAHWDPRTHEEALREVVHEALIDTWEGDGPWAPDHPNKTRENLIRSIIWYLDQFIDDPATTVRLENGRPAVELSFRMQLDFGPTGHLGDQPYLLCGHLDRVATFGGNTYVMDRKTTGHTITSRYWEQYSPDNQMSLYTIAAKIIYNIPISGIIIDAAQVAVTFTEFQRGFAFRTDPQLTEWLNDLRYWLSQAEAFAQANYWPQNDKSCHQYGGCMFRKVCSRSPEVRAIMLESDFERAPWNPLESR